jgi:protein phosphatase
MEKPTRLWTCTLCQQGIGRENNEDAVFVRNYTHERYAIFGVADGMGGLYHGEEASNEICRIFNNPIKQQPQKSLRYRAEEANTTLFGRKEKQGTTLSVVAVDKKDKSFYCLSIGDSRIYTYRQSQLNQISTDDKPTCLAFSPNIISNAIGLKETIGELNIISGEFFIEDLWLLTTDGIHTYIDSASIKETIQLYNKHLVVGELAKQAINRGSQDDITAVLCCIY